MAAMSLKIEGYASSPFTLERRRSSNLIGWQLMKLCNSKVNIRRQKGLRLPNSFCLVASSSKAASSSSSSDSSGGSSYEVFLSFNGKDVRTNFADHLYNALVDSGIRTFRDDNELQKGKEIGPDLVAAIQESRISIPIFSMNYGSSKWCLNELIEICECRRTLKQIVFPIFYKVEPRDVRNQTGVYAKAFEEHQKQFDQTTVQKWQNALNEVGKLDGWHSKEDTHEGKLIKIVVKTVWSELNKKPLVVSNDLVGIQTHIEKMLMMLDIESDNRKIVGIHGLGGIGKTTIARAVYNTIFHHFEGYSFVENIQENAQNNGLVHLQNQLVFNILKQKIHITCVDDGINVIQQRFRNKKLLIVLDDVDQDIHVKHLVGDRKWFGTGSKIIITSRNEDILCAQEVDEIYKPKGLDLDHSLQLFSNHAFRRNQPLEDYLDLSKAMIKTTGGLPLALQVIGSSLFSKKKSEWEGILKKLQKVPNNDIMKRLKISYDGIDDEEQQMFLDTACFFIGMNKDIACHIWDGCNFSSQVGLRALCVRSLVTIGERGELRMHDLLRDLGREIVRQESIKEPGKRSRIWSQEEVLDVLDTQTGTSNVEGLSIDFRSRSWSHYLISVEGFATMTKLRLLQFDYPKFSGNFTYSFSELRWLSWKGCHNQYVQTNFHPRKLAVLDLTHSEITKKWMGWNFIKMAINLKVLILTSCHQLTRTPDLSANRHLEVLILKDCKNLVEIDTSIGYLGNLVILDMSGCDSLVGLPMEILQLTSLERLNLEGCRNLSKLPEKLGHMISSTTLDLSGCDKLKSLPNLPRDLEVLILKDCRNLVEINTSIGYLQNLVKLDMSGCESLVDLPIEILQLTSLEELSLNGCQSLNKLPEKLCCMISLTTLDLRGCDRLKSLPNLPPSLKFFDASYCRSISSLPMLSSLKNLKVLRFAGCREILYMPNLPLSLTSLDFIGCSSIQNISSLPSSLVRLDIHGCSSIQYISDLPPSLTRLAVMDCSSIQYISDLPSNLIRLDVSCCSSIRYISILGLPSGLTHLDVSYCSSIQYISGLPSSLTHLHVSHCSSIRYISGVPSSLITLHVISCWSMKKLLSTSGLRNLETLCLDRCYSLEIEGVDKGLDSRVFFTMWGSSLKDFQKLKGGKKLRKLKLMDWGISDIEGKEMYSLEELEVGACLPLRKISNLSNSRQLRKLEINSCPNLIQIEGLEDCESLETFTVSDATSLKTLPDLSNLNKLQVLMIEHCGKLTEIPGLDRLESLRELKIKGCIAIQRLPDLSNLKNLYDLVIEDCQNLTEIHGVDRLDFLVSLDISGCESVERLPDLSNLKKLKILRAKSCVKLTEIQAVNGLESLEIFDVRGCLYLEKVPDLTILEGVGKGYGGYFWAPIMINFKKSFWMQLRGKISFTDSNVRKRSSSVDIVSDRRISSRSDLLRRAALSILAIFIFLFFCYLIYQGAIFILRISFIILRFSLFNLGTAFKMILFMCIWFYRLIWKVHQP